MRRLSLVFRALVIAWVVLVTLMTYAALRARGVAAAPKLAIASAAS